MTAPAHRWRYGSRSRAWPWRSSGWGLVIAAAGGHRAGGAGVGQCVFLPMLVIGGVAVPLTALPPWAQHVSAFFRRDAAGGILQACVNGGGRAAGPVALA